MFRSTSFPDKHDRPFSCTPAYPDCGAVHLPLSACATELLPTGRRFFVHRPAPARIWEYPVPAGGILVIRQRRIFQNGIEIRAASPELAETEDTGRMPEKIAARKTDFLKKEKHHECSCRIRIQCVFYPFGERSFSKQRRRECAAIFPASHPFLPFSAIFTILFPTARNSRQETDWPAMAASAEHLSGRSGRHETAFPAPCFLSGSPDAFSRDRCHRPVPVEIRLPVMSSPKNRRQLPPGAGPLFPSPPGYPCQPRPDTGRSPPKSSRMSITDDLPVAREPLSESHPSRIFRPVFQRIRKTGIQQAHTGFTGQGSTG